MPDDATPNDDAAAIVADAVNQNANPDTTPPDDSTNPPFMYAEGVPGTGEVPAYFKKDKYASISDQAKAYKDLETRFGSFTGAPDEYKINLSDEIKELGVEIAEDDPLLEEAFKFAKENQMNQDGFDNMMNLYALSKVAEQDALEDAKLEQMKLLGANANQRVENLEKWARANLDTELYEGFVEAAVTANSVRALEKLVAMTRTAPINPQEARPAGGITKEELDKMQFELDAYGNRRLQTDKEFRAKFKQLSEAFYGTEDHKTVVGG